MPDEVIDAPLDGGQPTDPNLKADPSPDNGGKDDGKSLGGGGGSEDGKVTQPADWPEDWRAKLAGDDEKLGKRLERFKSPKDVWQSFLNAEAKISSGQMKPVLPKDATEEDIAAYRKEIGVPDKPEGYLEKLPNGLVIGDADKPMAEGFLAAAHQANMPPEFVGAALDWYYKTQEVQVSETVTADKEFRVNAEEDLRAEFGGEYRVQQNSWKNFLDSTPVVGKDEDGKDVSLGDLMRGARTPDGRLLGDNPDFLRWVLGLAHKENPAGFVAPAGSGSQADSVADEIAKIEKVMRDNRPAYDKDEKMQARLRQLYDAQEKLASR